MKTNFKWLSVRVEGSEVEAKFEMRGKEYSFDPVTEIRNRVASDDYVEFSESINPQVEFELLNLKDKTSVFKRIEKNIKKACTKFKKAESVDLRNVVGMFVFYTQEEINNA